MSPARAVLEGMLRRIRAGGDSPLQFGIDAAGIVRASANEAGGPCDPAELDVLASELLGSTWTAGASTLESWVERFYAAARSVDPRAIEIVGLRFDGFDDRDIADRLDLGPRLVRRIREDIACSSP